MIYSLTETEYHYGETMTMLRRTALALVAAVAVPLAVACGGDGDDGATPAATPAPPTAAAPATAAATAAASTPTAAATAATATAAVTPTAAAAATAAATPDPSRAVVDATGETVTLDAPAVRVVCLTGLCVDTMFVLGVKPVAANDLLHKDDAYWGPGESEIGAISGSFFEPSLEDIARAEPDIVIGLFAVHDALRPALGSIAPLFIVNPIGVDGMLAHVAEIGILLGMEEEAAAASAAFESRLEQYVAGVTTRRSVMVVFGSDVNIGADTLCTPPIDALGRAADYGLDFPGCIHGEFPSFSVEQLLGIDPDVIFVQTFGFGPTPPQPVSEQLVDNAIWSALAAVQSGDVYEVDFFVWGTSRGIRGTTVVLDEAMPKIYPEDFPAALP